MRTYERNGVHVDQCTECRGIFLDRGELEKLVDAENSWHGGGQEASSPRPGAAPEGAPPAAATAPAAASGGLGAIVGEVLQQAKAAKSGSGYDRGHDDRGHDNRGDNRGYDRGGYPYKGKKKKSFLDELFG